MGGWGAQNIFKLKAEFEKVFPFHHVSSAVPASPSAATSPAARQEGKGEEEVGSQLLAE